MKPFMTLLCASALLLAAALFLPAISQETNPANTEKAGTTVAETMQKTTTLENLQAAFNGESNAHARYVEFAKKADEEGYTQVASLFRAAARAEEIHAANHAAVIRKMGAEPKATMEAPEVKTTRENLVAAITGETYEKDVMYPKFLDQARAENDKAAVRTFNFAKSAEAEHAVLYSDALNNIESWKGSTKEFLVCPVCGKTVTAIGGACPVCGTPGEKFLTVA